MTQELYGLLCPLLVKSFSRDLHTGEELFSESFTDKTVKFHITDLFFRFKLCTDRILQFTSTGLEEPLMVSFRKVTVSPAKAYQPTLRFQVSRFCPSA